MNLQLILAAIVMSGVTFIAGMFGGVKYERGQEAKRAIVAEQARSKVLMRAIEDRDAERIKADSIVRKVGEKYAAELDQVRASRDAAVGLRVDASICRPDDATAAAQASSPARPDAPAPGTVALPADVARNLLDLARRADEVTAQGRALQDWARQNGFAGTP